MMAWLGINNAVIPAKAGIHFLHFANSGTSGNGLPVKLGVTES